ncbi:MAG: YggS family pyridoxal phosphate-dependent enzyme [Prevotella sp.]|nr:YggS family pyridoxal phosphate-dependent enzyme [Prevotella sp.]
MTVGENIKEIYRSLPEGAALVAVSKFHSAESIMEAYRAGQRAFGESYVKELLGKYDALPKDIRWHFIGHLQTNKVRQIIPFVSLIQSVDSVRLVREIQRCAHGAGRVVDVLFELHIAQETTKSGFTPEECMAFLSAFDRAEYPNVHPCGVMTMATNTEMKAQIEREFNLANGFFAEAKARFFPSDDSFCIRSWGMSDDYDIALRAGANMIRVGTKIFGARQYPAR